jgi:phage baseplate assembly protein W
MPQIINQQFEIDSDDRRIVGFGFPLSANNVFAPTFTMKDQIRANLINFVLTNHGERVNNPTFGANLREIIFEGIHANTTNIIEQRIRDVIALEFPDIKIDRIEFNNKEDENMIHFSLFYKITPFNIEDELNIAIQ